MERIFRAAQGGSSPRPAARFGGRAVRWVALAAVGLLLAACGTPAVPEGADLATLPVGQWVRLPVGGETVCADGSRYAAQVRRGTDDTELVVSFQGGGATWGEIEGADGWLQKEFLSELYYERVRTVSGAGLSGPPDDDPLTAATQVVVSYCSGDVHWGDAFGVDAKGRPIEHRGVVNVEAVLGWLDEQGLAPERLTLAGCSAGGYGALLWAPSLVRLYPDAAPSLLIDAALGVAQRPFVTGSVGLASWRVDRGFQANGREDLLADINEDYFELLLAALAAEFGGPIGVATTDRDGIQAAFHYLMGESPVVTAFRTADVDAWSAAAQDRIGRLNDIEGVSTFVSDWGPALLPFAATGHCVTEHRDMWRDGMGDAFRAWWGEIRAGTAPASVDLRQP